MTSICEEQRRLDEEHDLLGTGSGDSAADETELLNMDIDDEDEASLVVHKEPKPSGVGTVDSKSLASTEATRSSAITTAVGTDNTVTNTNTVGIASHTKEVDTMPAPAGASSVNTTPVDTACTIGATGVNTKPVDTSGSTKPLLGVGRVDPALPSPEASTDGTYLAINLYKRKAGTAPNLLCGTIFASSATGTLFNGKAERIKLCTTSWDFHKKANVMTSFNPGTLECDCCDEHTKILEKRVLTRPVYRRTFVLTDQNFISAAPASTDSGQCLKIVRIENATLWDLHHFLRDLIFDRDLSLPVGSAILLGSVSHLSNVGPAAYAEELVQISMRMNQMFDGSIYVIPCPPMLLDGSSNVAAIRALCETIAWLKHVMHGDNCFLTETHKVVTDLLIARATSMAPASHTRVMMPTSLNSSCRARWDSGGTNLPAGVLPLSPKEEEQILYTMIRELNSNFAMHLDPAPDLSPTNNKLRKGQCFLLVGASNAGRTADALEQLGVNVLRAVIPGWRGLKMKVQPMVDLVRSKLKEAGPNCIVVHQLLDNSFYLAKTEEGGLIPAVRETIGGKYHVQGELVFAPKELQYSIFTTVKPIFDEASSHHQILISPLPRYLRDRCCSDLDHVANLEEDDYATNLEESLQTCRRNLKDFAFRQGIRNMRVICPWTSLKKMTINLWPVDPVHMCQEGFSAMAELVLSTAKQNEGMDLVPSKKTNSNRGGGGGSGGSDGGNVGRGGSGGHDEGGGGSSRAWKAPRGRGGQGRGWRGRHHY